MSKIRMMDANEAVASVAFRSNEVIAIYPITPASPMGEWADDWAAHGQENLWKQIPDVVEMQSEGGAIGAVHGALQSGSLTTTFTASQGLLLMIPNMYKIAGELTPFVLHVAARSLATHALSIFGDHSDVMACRQTGFAMLCSNSVQEAHDFAAISQAASLKSRVPYLHFFDGFRTSHEINKVDILDDGTLRELYDPEDIQAHRERALTPDRPRIRGTAQNPDTFFQAREAANPYYDECPRILIEAFEEFGKKTGRTYRLFDYVGHPEAEKVIIMMGSGAEAAHETVNHMVENGEKVGLLKVRLFRPFSIAHFVEALPASVKKLAVLDRTKEPGAIGDPLYMDILSALSESGKLQDIQVFGGRYGLSSKEFHPGMVKGVFNNLGKDQPKNHFTVGIIDDVTQTSIDTDQDFDIEPEDTVRAVFYGLGADGTVGANKNSIKIIGEGTDNFAQGYFVYDSKKSGAMTISHLRFGPKPIQSSYLVRKSNFIGCHQFNFVEKYDILETAAENAVFLLNAPYGKDEVWDHLPKEIQETIIEKNLKFYVIDAYSVARDTGMGFRINTIMQTCFFAISGVLEKDEAIKRIKDAIEKTYSKRGPEVVQKNFDAVDAAVSHMHEVSYPKEVTSKQERPPVVSGEAPDFVQKVTAVMMAQKGDLLPVSAFTVDGTWPTGTTKWEKRNIAQSIPIWDSDVCIQCNKCSLICPHAAIRAKVYDPKDLDGAPDTFKSTKYRGREFENKSYTIQVAPEDCTGCNLCVNFCPAKDKSNPRHKAINMELQLPIREREVSNYDFFLSIPEADRKEMKMDVKGTQFLQPLFEYNGACAGCGETPYVKLLTQMFGDRLLISNATGCSSIYGGNLPTTPYTQDTDGRGPAWSNSLFEDNAEFGLGFRLSVDFHEKQALSLLKACQSDVGEDLIRKIVENPQLTEADIAQQREYVDEVKKKIEKSNTDEAKRLSDMGDYLVKKSVWILGGDGWAYDIGYGGVDHVLSLNRNINILVLDTEVYSNTGGQASKATPLGASAKFAMAGKSVGKKDLGMMAMTYGNVYVARIAMGAKDLQTVKALQEAASYPGPSLIIAYSHCIAHGYDMAQGAEQQKRAVQSGIWPLYRFDPRQVREGKAPLQMDSPPIKLPVRDYMLNEARFRMTEKMDPKRFQYLMKEASFAASQRFSIYEQLSKLMVPTKEEK